MLSYFRTHCIIGWFTYHFIAYRNTKHLLSGTHYAYKIQFGVQANVQANV